MLDALGWISSLVLLATIAEQIRKQWKARSDQGVSSFLFVGQSAASLGFTVYSALVGNWVFTVTNGLLFASALTGWLITAHFKRGNARARGPAPNASTGQESPQVST